MKQQRHTMLQHPGLGRAGIFGRPRLGDGQRGRGNSAAPDPELPRSGRHQELAQGCSQAPRLIQHHVMSGIGNRGESCSGRRLRLLCPADAGRG